MYSVYVDLSRYLCSLDVSLYNLNSLYLLCLYLCVKWLIISLNEV